MRLLRTTFRDNGKIKHQQHGRITGCTIEQLKLLQLSFREKVVHIDDPGALKILQSRELGASKALSELAKQIGLPQLLYSHSQPWLKSAMAMIVGRLIYPGSKLSLCKQHKNTYLWEISGIEGSPDVNEHCYPVMDQLLKRQKSIQKKLAKKHLNSLLSGQVIQPDLFDEILSNEVFDPQVPEKRYCLCRNEGTAIRESKTRERLIELTIGGLEMIANYQRKTSVEKLGARVGKVLAQYKVGKFFDWSIESAEDALSRSHRLIWTLKNEKIVAEKGLDGYYIISTDVAPEQMNTRQVVATYKSLNYVEQAFRTMKTTHLHVRPVYHKIDRRIRGHLFLCMLSYYLQWHMRQRLQPLFKTDGEHKNREWTIQSVIQCLSQLTRNKVSMGETVFYRNSMPTEEQQ